MEAGSAVSAALGSISLAADRPVRRNLEKLAGLQPGTAEFDWMLATYCFDLARKLEYICKATLDYAPQADRQLARQVFTDNEAINENGLSWEARARRAEQILRNLYEEIGPRHEEILRALGGGGAASQ
jgi:hypothetical protein